MRGRSLGEATGSMFGVRGENKSACRGTYVIESKRWGCKQAQRPPLCIQNRRARDVCASNCVPLACVRCAVILCRCPRGISRRRDGCLGCSGNPRYHPLAESLSQAQRGTTLRERRACVLAYGLAFWFNTWLHATDSTHTAECAASSPFCWGWWPCWRSSRLAMLGTGVGSRGVCNK